MKIISIEVVGIEDTVDFELDGDRLFYANGILTHNSGMQSSDIEMTDIAESIGIPGVCDFMLAATRSEEMDAIGQLGFKQLKNRFRKMQYRPRFVLGCEFDQQLFYDVSDSEQDLAVSIPARSVTSRGNDSEATPSFSTATQSRFEKGGFRPRTRDVKIDVGDYDNA